MVMVGHNPKQASGQKRGMPGSALHQVRCACSLQLLSLLVECAVHTLILNPSCVRCAYSTTTFVAGRARYAKYALHTLHQLCALCLLSTDSGVVWYAGVNSASRLVLHSSAINTFGLLTGSTLVVYAVHSMHCICILYYSRVHYAYFPLTLALCAMRYAGVNSVSCLVLHRQRYQHLGLTG